MADTELLCNYKKCRKRLSTHAWVTACSHIFCDDDGTREFGKSFSCPACETNLSSDCEVVRVNLQPGEQYKSMVLAGLKPEIIMEICSSALSFWMYQYQQERTYQEFVNNKAKERNIQLERYYEEMFSRTKTERGSLISQIDNYKKELDTIKKKLHLVSEQLSEKSRQYQKLQAQLDKLKRKSIDPTMLVSASDDPPVPKQHHGNFTLPFGGGDTEHDLRRRADVRRNVDSGRHMRSTTNSPNTSFVLRPQHTPLYTSHFPTDEAATAIHDRFNLELGGTTSTGTTSVSRSCTSSKQKQ